MNISIPSTSSKIIGSISYFLEPIVLTNVLMYVGYSKEFIVYEYGVINAYAMSLLLMPQFFTQNIKRWSSNWNNREKAKSKIWTTCVFHMRKNE